MMNRSSLQPGEIKENKIKKIMNGLEWMAHLILPNGHLRCQALRWYKTTLEERCMARRDMFSCENGYTSELRAPKEEELDG